MGRVDRSGGRSPRTRGDSRAGRSDGHRRPSSGSIVQRIRSRMLVLAIIPLVVVGLTASVLAVRSARDARDSLASSREDLLTETIGGSRAEEAEQFLTDSTVVINDRFDLLISWRAVPDVVAGAAEERPEVDQLVTLPTDQVEARFADGAVLDSTGRLSRLLASYTAARPEFAELFFTDANGFNVASSGPTSDFVQSDEGWWQRAWADGASIGTLDFDESAGVQSVDLAVRIEDPTTGRPLGVLKGVVDARDLYSAASPSATGWRPRTTVANTSGSWGRTASS